MSYGSLNRWVVRLCLKLSNDVTGFIQGMSSRGWGLQQERHNPQTNDMKCRCGEDQPDTRQ